jgi:hypothetical protein
MLWGTLPTVPLGFQDVNGAAADDGGLTVELTAEDTVGMPEGGFEPPTRGSRAELDGACNAGEEPGNGPKDGSRRIR